jgi:hypothetical protein
MLQYARTITRSTHRTFHSKLAKTTGAGVDSAGSKLRRWTIIASGIETVYESSSSFHLNGPIKQIPT